MNDRVVTTTQLKVALLTIHPAPYRDSTLAIVHQRRRVNLKVYLLSRTTSRHPYWREGAIPYPHEILEPELGTSGGFYLNLGVWHRLKGYDVVCITGHQYHTLKIALLQCLITGTPYVWIADSMLQRPPPSWSKALRRQMYHLIVRFIVEHMGSAWVPGQATREYLVYHGAAQNKIFEGAYCLDAGTLVQQIRPLEAQRKEIRRTLNLSDDQIVFLFVGRLASQRGIPILLEAWRRLTAAHPEVALMIVGQGPERLWAEQFTREHELTQVQFFDPVTFETLPKYYVACDAYIQPSINEPYSLSTAQAATSARPMVITDRVGAGADYLVEGQTGYLAQAGNVDSLVEAMKKLVTQRQRMVEMGQEAQKIARLRTPLWAAEQFEQAVLVAYQGHSRTRI